MSHLGSVNEFLQCFQLLLFVLYLPLKLGDCKALQAECILVLLTLLPKLGDQSILLLKLFLKLGIFQLPLLDISFQNLDSRFQRLDAASELEEGFFL